MYAVTERGVVGRQVDCSILWLQRLQSSYFPDWSLSRWQRGSRTQQIGDVVGLAKTSQAHSQQPGTEAPVHAGTRRPSPPVYRQYAYEREASEVQSRWAWCDQTFCNCLYIGVLTQNFRTVTSMGWMMIMRSAFHCVCTYLLNPITQGLVT